MTECTERSEGHDDMVGEDGRVREDGVVREVEK
jgi:hypothetical protein